MHKKEESAPKIFRFGPAPGSPDRARGGHESIGEEFYPTP